MPPRRMDRESSGDLWVVQRIMENDGSDVFDSLASMDKAWEI